MGTNEEPDIININDMMEHVSQEERDSQIAYALVLEDLGYMRKVVTPDMVEDVDVAVNTVKNLAVVSLITELRTNPEAMRVMADISPSLANYASTI